MPLCLFSDSVDDQDGPDIEEGLIRAVSGSSSSDSTGGNASPGRRSAARPMPKQRQWTNINTCYILGLFCFALVAGAYCTGLLFPPTAIQKPNEKFSSQSVPSTAEQLHVAIATEPIVNKNVKSKSKHTQPSAQRTASSAAPLIEPAPKSSAPAE
eukprot:61924_1